jgi:RNA polymerase sigma-70 factor, ECF subfamily
MVQERRLELVRSGPALPGLDDDDLMKLAATGARDAFRELVRRYHGPVSGICVRSTASAEEGREIAQEVFVSLWQSARSYVPRGTFPSFLFTITRNLLRSAARRRLRAAEATTEISAIPPLASADQLDQLLATENERRLREALSDLSDTHRHAILLRFSADLPYEEIARICGAPEGTVRSWVHHGIKRLRHRLGEG